MKKTDYMSRLNNNLVAKHSFLELCTLAFERHENSGKMVENLLSDHVGPNLSSKSPQRSKSLANGIKEKEDA